MQSNTRKDDAKLHPNTGETTAWVPIATTPAQDILCAALQWRQYGAL
jgi:hypothetical protein